jgi:hypothetical protein
VVHVLPGARLALALRERAVEMVVEEVSDEWLRFLE